MESTYYKIDISCSGNSPFCYSYWITDNTEQATQALSHMLQHNKTCKPDDLVTIEISTVKMTGKEYQKFLNENVKL